MFNWLFANKRKSASATPELSKREVTMSELAMRENIADKLKSYNADEDTTASDFSLPDDEKGTKAVGKMRSIKDPDVWGQANPGETGKWTKEVRHNRAQVSRHSTQPQKGTFERIPSALTGFVNDGVRSPPLAPCPVSLLTGVAGNNEPNNRHS
ncbi:MAG: hypothetical protein GY785_18765 [Gammaproteobacteria bacterium]|nr:hypothetical protein [Gammaproteobacteria bacterium]